MIKFQKISKEEPFLIFKKKYDNALSSGQRNIEAISISSFNASLNEVQSRYVNVKYIYDNKFIFFSNYNSPKAQAFKTHNQISGLFFWPTINLQIRIKATIKKTNRDYNLKYFKERSFEKNALAISSEQSNRIKSYESVISNYNDVFKNKDLSTCPDYWGGFEFIPYYFEFWEGHNSRLNKRIVFEKIDVYWERFIIQP